MNPNSQDDLREQIEDWLDNAAHSGKLPVKINFSDIQKVAEILTPTLLAHQDKLISEIIGEDVNCDCKAPARSKLFHYRHCARRTNKIRHEQRKRYQDWRKNE